MSDSRPVSVEGIELDAAFAVEEEGDTLSVVLRSATGRKSDSRPINPDYADALELLIVRLAESRAVLLDAMVDSASTRRRGLTESERRLVATGLSYPLPLANVVDPRELRLQLTRAAASVGRAAGGASNGSYRKQIRLFVEFPTRPSVEGLRAHLAAQQQPGQEDSTTFDPKDETDARKRIERSIVVRQGGARFRADILCAYHGTCFLTGSRCEAVLEAAHVRPYAGEHTNYPANGMLLRGDVHTLFDRGLVGIDTSGEAWRVVLAPSLVGSEYETALKPGSFPTYASSAPLFATLKMGLELHRKRFGL